MRFPWPVFALSLGLLLPARGGAQEGAVPVDAWFRFQGEEESARGYLHLAGTREGGHFHLACEWTFVEDGEPGSVAIEAWGQDDPILSIERMEMVIREGSEEEETEFRVANGSLTMASDGHGRSHAVTRPVGIFFNIFLAVEALPFRSGAPVEFDFLTVPFDDDLDPGWGIIYGGREGALHRFIMAELDELQRPEEEDVGTFYVDEGHVLQRVSVPPEHLEFVRTTEADARAVYEAARGRVSEAAVVRVEDLIERARLAAGGGDLVLIAVTNLAEDATVDLGGAGTACYVFRRGSTSPQITYSQAARYGIVTPYSNDLPPTYVPLDPGRLDFERLAEAAARHGVRFPAAMTVAQPEGQAAPMASFGSVILDAYTGETWAPRAPAPGGR